MDVIISNLNLLSYFMVIFLVLFRSSFRKSSVKRNVVLLMVAVLFVVENYFEIMGNKIVIGPLSLSIILIIIGMFFLFQLSLEEGIVWGLWGWLFLSFLEGLGSVSIESFVKDEFWRGNIVVFCITLCICFLRLTVGEKSNLRALKIPIKIWCTIDMVLVVLTIMMAMFYYIVIQKLAESREIIFGKIGMIGGSIAILIGIFAILFIYDANSKNKMVAEVTEKLNQQQREYYAHLLKQQEEIKKFRHDVKHDFYVMQKYCEKQEYERLSEYLSQMVGDINRGKEKIYESGNEAVDMMLNSYLEPLKEKMNLRITGKIKHEIMIPERDLCIIVANIFKNISEAIEKAGGGKVQIQFSAGWDYLQMKFANSYVGSIKFDKKGQPITSKSDKDNHGFGTKTIKELVERSGGKVEMKIENKLFITDIILKLARSRQVILN